MLARITALETQIAKERAKREATAGLARNLRTQLNAAEEERTLAEECADKAERELAEERACAAKEDMARLAMRDRAEKAEARIAELEGVLHHYAFCPEVPGGTPLEKVPEWLSKRVAELQALVDAATTLLRRWRERGFPMGGASVWDETIAFLDARDLAAKEKEPAR